MNSASIVEVCMGVYGSLVQVHMEIYGRGSVYGIVWFP